MISWTMSANGLALGAVADFRQCHFSEINAVASISTKKSGFAKPATTRTEIAGGFFKPPKNFCEI